MAEIKDFPNLFRLDGKVAVVTGGKHKHSSVENAWFRNQVI
jgi:hypothetical protein